MSFLFGSSSDRTSTTRPQVLPQFEQLLGPLSSGALTAFNTPWQGYQGSAVAPLNTDQLSAFDRIRDRASSGAFGRSMDESLQYLRGASAPIRDVAATRVGALPISTREVSADDIRSRMSPFTSEVIDTTLAEMDRKKGIDDARLRARAHKTRGYGTARHELRAAEADRDYSDVRARTAAGLRERGYESARDQFNTDLMRKLQADINNQSAGLRAGIANQDAGLRAAISNQGKDATYAQILRNLALDRARLGTAAQEGDYRDIQALAGVGDVLQQQDQRNKDFQLGEFRDQKAWPWQQVMNLLRVVSGSPTGSIQTTPGPSPLSQIAGTALIGSKLFGFKDGGLVRLADGGSPGSSMFTEKALNDLMATLLKPVEEEEPSFFEDPIVQLGLGMLASDSPYPLQALGEAGMMAAESAAGGRKGAREAKLRNRQGMMTAANVISRTLENQRQREFQRQQKLLGGRGGRGGGGGGAAAAAGGAKPLDMKRYYDLLERQALSYPQFRARSGAGEVMLNERGAAWVESEMQKRFGGSMAAPPDAGALGPAVPAAGGAAGTDDEYPGGGLNPLNWYNRLFGGEEEDAPTASAAPPPQKMVYTPDGQLVPAP